MACLFFVYAIRNTGLIWQLETGGFGDEFRLFPIGNTK